MTDARVHFETAEVLVRATPPMLTKAKLHFASAEALVRTKKPAYVEPPLDPGSKSAKSLIAVNGAWKSSDIFVAVDGRWKATAGADLAYGGVWRTAHLPAPQLMMWNVTKSPDAPWSRITYEFTVNGDWDEIRLYVTQPNGNVTYYSWTTPDLIAVPPTELPDKYVPGGTYMVELKYSQSGTGIFKTIASAQVTMDQPPVPTAFAPRYPITYAAGGMEWAMYRDVDDWHSRNNTVGGDWLHGGNLPYVYYYSGLVPNTAYRFQTQANVTGQWGQWSNEFAFATADRPWVPGSYSLLPNGDSGTYQSGGPQTTRWQHSENRDSWYGGNCNTCVNNPSTRGFQRTAFYYQRDATWNQLVDWINKGAQIVRAEVFIARANTENGIWGAIRCPIALNGNYIPTPPWNVSGNVLSPLLARGQSAWCEIPSHWAHHILMGSAAVPTLGMLVGDINSINNYLQMLKSSGTGVLRVTIG